MLTEVEFKDKEHIILDKFDTTYIMNRVNYKTPWHWQIFSINRKYISGSVIEGECMTDDEAYTFYRERMESYGFKRFPVIEE